MAVDMNSILTSIKKLTSLPEEYDAFDEDVIFFINTTFSTLWQLGVGPDTGFKIADESTKWSDYISDDLVLLGMVQDFMKLKVRLKFDPPTLASVLKAMQDEVKELEYRIPLQVDLNKVNKGAKQIYL